MSLRLELWDVQGLEVVYWKKNLQNESEKDTSKNEGEK